MMTSLAISLSLTFLASATAPATSADAQPRLTLTAIEATGLDKEEIAQLPNRLSDELALIGAELVEPAQGAASGQLGVDGHLEVDVVRVGPLVEVSLALKAPTGELLIETQRQLGAGAIGAATLIGPEMAAAIRVLGPTNATGAAGELDDEAEAVLAPDDALASSWLTWSLAGAGACVVVMGGMVAALSAGVVLYETWVSQDPNSLGIDKARTEATRPVAAGTGLAAGLVIVGGMALASTSLVVE